MEGLADKNTVCTNRLSAVYIEMLTLMSIGRQLQSLEAEIAKALVLNLT